MKLLKGLVTLRAISSGEQIGQYKSSLPYSPVIITASHKLFFIIATASDVFNHIPQFHIYFRAVRKNLRDSLHIVQTSPVSGYIQPVGLVLEKLYGFPIYNNASYRLVLPAEHVVMTSIQWMLLGGPFYCQTHLYLFSELGKQGDQLIWRRCRGHELTPEVYNTSLVIRFQGKYGDSNRGFKMVYTFHAQFKSPKRLPNGMFNCSVSYYRDFKEHVHCNLKQECEGREDEGGHCTFSSQACNGSVATTNKCLHLYGKSLLKLPREKDTVMTSFLSAEEQSSKWISFSSALIKKRMLDSMSLSVGVLSSLLSSVTEHLKQLYAISLLPNWTYFQNICKMPCTPQNSISKIIPNYRNCKH